ncbi:hypothetical protein PROFUN_07738 [Planoprotostelium fungivorum]|uniref:Bulb-type lectin domain-containing protein n=1 Tax=Planoprotostelium fungivorum TaxID=1890364 RepID=A0A2P6N1E8_9EUKA|nr:hypothetical protein PROFUN_07738 [Planoprotostelium fungivorum]
MAASLCFTKEQLTTVLRDFDAFFGSDDTHNRVERLSTEMAINSYVEEQQKAIFEKNGINGNQGLMDLSKCFQLFGRDPDVSPLLNFVVTKEEALMAFGTSGTPNPILKMDFKTAIENSQKRQAVRENFGKLNVEQQKQMLLSMGLDMETVEKIKEEALAVPESQREMYIQQRFSALTRANGDTSAPTRAVEHSQPATETTEIAAPKPHLLTKSEVAGGSLVVPEYSHDLYHTIVIVTESQHQLNTFHYRIYWHFGSWSSPPQNNLVALSDDLTRETLIGRNALLAFLASTWREKKDKENFITQETACPAVQTYNMKRVVLLLFLVWTCSAACIAPMTGGFSDTILQNALNQGGVNYTLSLCQNAVYRLNATIDLTSVGQEISTEGYPSGDARATLLVAGAFSVVINGHLNRQKLRNIQVNGNRIGLGRFESGGANIEVGGNVQGQVVDNIRSFDPRGWSCLHMTEGGCTGGSITNSQIGPAGYPNGTWADGISLACRNTLVANNLITDATDGNIVVFGAPGSRIINNTIIVDSRVALGGINLVDYGPYSGDYTGTIIDGNTVWARGAQIKAAIAAGTRVWGDTSGNTNFGATITNNIIKGNYLAYGIPVSGVNNFTVTNNIFSGSYSGSNAYCGTRVTNAPPSAMVFDPRYVSNSNLQSGYIKGQVDYSICIQPGVSPSLTYVAGQFSLSSGQSIQLNGSTFTLQDNCNFVARDDSGKALWASNTIGYSGECSISFRENGRLVISDLGNDIWTFPNYTGNLSGGEITFSSSGSHVTINDPADDIIYATSYAFPSFELYTSHFIHQTATDGTEYYLFIAPNGSVTVSTGAANTATGRILWSSPTFFAANCSQPSQCHLTLQGGDGNVVLYNDSMALWATGGGASAVRFNTFQPYFETINATGSTLFASSDRCAANNPCKNNLVCNGAFCGTQAWANGTAYTSAPVAGFTSAFTRTALTSSPITTSPLHGSAASLTFSLLVFCIALFF